MLTKEEIHREYHAYFQHNNIKADELDRYGIKLASELHMPCEDAVMPVHIVDWLKANAKGKYRFYWLRHRPAFLQSDISVGFSVLIQFEKPGEAVMLRLIS